MVVGQPIQLHTSHPQLPSGTNWNYRPGPPLMLVRCDSATGQTTLHNDRGLMRTWRDPFEAFGWMTLYLKDCPWPARWVGFLSYDLGRFFEEIPASAQDDLKLPLLAFTFHAEVEKPRPPVLRPQLYRISDAPLRSTFTREAYEAAVQRAIDYIAAGDIFQVNLSQRFSVGVQQQPQEIYHRLLTQSPAWYGAYLNYGDFALLSNSPELFFRISRQPDGSRKIVTRPIKGTRPRKEGMDKELRQSLKDQAELNMIVDLERNDLGRICEIGSVRVVEARAIEAHPTVYHGVATIEGTLRADTTFTDVLFATFPGGSITGAPKIRAMQIIEELEPVRRGPYCGAIGYLASDGTVEFNIAIRTMIIKDGLAYIPVGGGIVADSIPADEFVETLVKARALFASLGIEIWR